MEKFKEFFQRFGVVDKYLAIFMIVGAGIASVALFRGILWSSQVQVEHIEANRSVDNDIYVDVGGAVVSPGVYKMPIKSRLKDALIAAGGYSADADRSYTEKVFNLAEVISDGQKVFVPRISDTPILPGYPEANSSGNLINVNTVSASELDTLEGIGSVRAENIVKNRPYKSLDELVSKKVLTQSILDKNRGLLSVY